MTPTQAAAPARRRSSLRWVAGAYVLLLLVSFMVRSSRGPLPARVDGGTAVDVRPVAGGRLASEGSVRLALIDLGASDSHATPGTAHPRQSRHRPRAHAAGGNLGGAPPRDCARPARIRGVDEAPPRLLDRRPRRLPRSVARSAGSRERARRGIQHGRRRGPVARGAHSRAHRVADVAVVDWSAGVRAARRLPPQPRRARASARGIVGAPRRDAAHGVARRRDARRALRPQLLRFRSATAARCAGASPDARADPARNAGSSRALRCGARARAARSSK